MNASGKTVMVIDDDKALRESVCELLEDDGYHAVCIPSASAALDHLRTHEAHPDLILLDLMMPGLTGWQFRERQLDDPSLAGIPVVVMTASRDVRGIDAEEVVYKPLKLDRLLDVVERHVGNGGGTEAPGGGDGRADREPPTQKTADPAARTIEAPPDGPDGASVPELSVAERHLRIVHALVARVVGARDPDDACRLACDTLAGSADVRFAGSYLVDSRGALVLVAAAGENPPVSSGPVTRTTPDPFSLFEVLDFKQPRVIQTGEERTVALPLAHGAHKPHGVLLLGVPAWAVLDDSLHDLFSTLAEVLASAIGRLHAEGAALARRDTPAEVARLREVAHLAEAREEKFRSIVTQQALAGIAQTDLTGKFELANDRYLEIVGRAQAEVYRIRRQDIVHPEDLPAFEAQFARLVELGTPFIIENRYVRPDGSIVWVQNSVARIDDADGKPKGVASVTVDVTQRKFAERALIEREARQKAIEEQREARLAEVERSLAFSETFVGVLGHDLRNPLHAIITAAQLLLRRETNPRVAAPLQRILNSSDRMARMIEQILDFTRARIGGGIPITPAPVDLGRLASQLVDELAAGDPKRVTLAVNGDVRGKWDPDRLSQVISNLLDNAIDHGTPGEPIRLGLDGSERDRVRLEVWNGGAIPEDVLPSLFEPFRGAAGRARRHKAKGLGLGLYIVQQIVEAHGGELEVRSSEADGTLLAVAMPRISFASEDEDREQDEDQDQETQAGDVASERSE